MISGGGKCTDQPMHPRCWAGWYLLIVQNFGTSMEVCSMLHMCCIWVEQVGPDYPETCCLPCLIWPSQMALSQQAHCLQMVLELRFLYAQPLLLVCHPWPALSWDWWVANSFYAGSGCARQIPKAYHIDWYIGIGPPHTPCFPMGFVFYGGPWRHQLTLEISSLIWKDLFGQSIVDNEIVPEVIGSCLGSLGSCHMSLGISGKVVCHH